MITVAPTGAETRKADAPALPVTLDELVATAQACEAAGAALVHVHIRDDDARPSLDLTRLADTVSALREATEALGGRVDVESLRGRGTRLRCVFARASARPPRRIPSMVPSG